MEEIKDLVLTPHQVAVELGISREAAYKLFHRSDFPRLIPNAAKPLLVSRGALTEFLSGASRAST